MVKRTVKVKRTTYTNPHQKDYVKVDFGYR